MKSYLKQINLLSVKWCLVLILCLSTSIHAEDQTISESFKDFIAKSVLFMAWPTAEYISSEYDRTSRKDNGDIYVIFKINAKSAWTGGPLWLQAIVVLDSDYNIKDVKYGDYKAVFPPGFATSVAIAMINEDGKKYNGNRMSSQISTPDTQVSSSTTQISTSSTQSRDSDNQNNNGLDERIQINKEVTSFTRNYVDSVKSNDLDLRVSFYAPLVDFYSKTDADHSFIRNDIFEHQIKPYPERDFSLRSDLGIQTITKTYVIVKYTIDYILKKENGSIITSNRIISMDLVNDDGRWLIKKEKVVGSRNSEDEVIGFYKVIADPSLVVRSIPDTSGEKLGNIANGDKVKVLSKTDKRDTINGHSGAWVKIQWRSDSAYVFGGFLESAN